MAMKLQIYLKRTEQTLEGWLRDNGVTKVADLEPRCAYLGLSVDPADAAAVDRILTPSAPEEKRSKKKKLDEPIEG
jgi:hypothetical protein